MLPNRELDIAGRLPIEEARKRPFTSPTTPLIGDEGARRGPALRPDRRLGNKTFNRDGA